LKQLSKHLSFANAISCIALFVALSGAAYAAQATLGRKAVKTQNLANGAVTTLKLKGGAVTTLKLKNGAVTGAKIANATIGATQLAKGAVRSEQLGGGVVTSAKLKKGAVNSEAIANNAVSETQLSPNAVGLGKIQKGVISSANLTNTFLAQLVKSVSYVAKASASNNTEDSNSIVAECPTGKQVVGGGAKLVGANLKAFVTESSPVVSGEKRTGWSATARAAEAGGNSWAVEATAICAEF
jgi:hypothetical protein